MKLSHTLLAASTLLLSCAAETASSDIAAGADTYGPMRSPTAPPAIPTLAGVVPRLRTRPVQPTVFEV